MDQPSEVRLENLGNGMWVGICGDRSISITESNRDLAVRLGDLATFAGYAGEWGPAELARILKKGVDDGLIDRSWVVGPNSSWKSGIPRKDWTLTRKAALLLMTRCTKPRCIEFTRKMADVFDLWLNQRHTSVSGSTPGIDPTALHILQSMERTVRQCFSQMEALTGTVNTLAKIVAALPNHGDLTQLRQRIESQTLLNGLVGKERAQRILDRIGECADGLGAIRTYNRVVWASERKRIETEVRKAASWPQIGAVYKQLDSGLPNAELKLQELEAKIDASTRARIAEARAAAKSRRKKKSDSQTSFHGIN